MQVDGLAMGASLAVILANLWLKEYEFVPRQEIPVGTEIQPVNDKNGLRTCCRRKSTYRSKGVESECCRNWYHLKCGKMSDDFYATITEITAAAASLLSALDNIELPGWVYEVLSMGPKHPIRDKFNETHFFGGYRHFLFTIEKSKNIW